MGRYLIRRAIISIFTLIAISIVVYTILALAPGDPLSGFANNPNVPPELRERIRKTMGLDDPIYVQYLRWASAYVQGDWLQSYSAKIPVRDYVLARLPTTLMISGSAFLLSILVAVPIGVALGNQAVLAVRSGRDDVRFSRFQHPDVLLRHPHDPRFQRLLRLASVRL